MKLDLDFDANLYDQITVFLSDTDVTYLLHPFRFERFLRVTEAIDGRVVTVALLSTDTSMRDPYVEIAQGKTYQNTYQMLPNCLGPYLNALESAIRQTGSERGCVDVLRTVWVYDGTSETYTRSLFTAVLDSHYRDSIPSVTKLIG